MTLLAERPATSPLTTETLSQPLAPHRVAAAT